MDGCNTFTFTADDGSEKTAHAVAFETENGKLYIRAELDGETGLFKVPADQMKSMQTKWRILGQPVDLDIGMFNFLINLPSERAQMLAITMLENSVHGTNMTSELSAVLKYGELVGKHDAEHERLWSRYVAETRPKRPHLERNRFEKAVSALIEGDEKEAYRIIGQQDYTPSQGPDPLKYHRMAAKENSLAYKAVAEAVGVPVDEKYLPAISSRSKFEAKLKELKMSRAEGLKLIGREVFGGALLSAVKKGLRNDLTPEQARKVGEAYAENLYMGLNLTNHERSFSMGAKGSEKESAIAKLMSEAGVSREQATELVDILNMADDPAKPSHLRYRTVMDRTFRTTVKDGKGHPVELSVSDFFDRNAKRVLENYSDRMARYANMMEVGGGLHDRAKWDAHLAAVHKELTLNGESPAVVERALENLEMVWRMQMGYPPLDGQAGMGNRLAKALMDISYLKFMGNFMASNITELWSAMVGGTLRSFWHHAGFTRLIKEWADGVRGISADSPLAYELRAIGVMINERRTLFKRELDEYVDELDAKLESKLGTARDLHSRAFGVGAMSRVQLEASFAMHFQRFWMIATGKGGVMDSAYKERWARYGFDEGMDGPVAKDFLKYVEVDKGVVTNVRLSQWQAENPQTFMKFYELADRESHFWWARNRPTDEPDAVHRSAVARMLMQFKGWMLPTYQRMIKGGVAKGDAVAILKFFSTVALCAIWLPFENWLKYGDDEEELAKRNSPEELLKAAIVRSGVAFMVPGVMDTIATATGHEKVFGNNGRGSGLSVGLIDGAGSYATTAEFLNAGRILGQMAFSGDNDVTTRSEYKALAEAILPRFMAIQRGLNVTLDWLDAPEKNPRLEPMFAQ